MWFKKIKISTTFVLPMSTAQSIMKKIWEVMKNLRRWRPRTETTDGSRRPSIAAINTATWDREFPRVTQGSGSLPPGPGQTTWRRRTFINCCVLRTKLISGNRQTVGTMVGLIHFQLLLEKNNYQILSQRGWRPASEDPGYFQRSKSPFWNATGVKVAWYRGTADTRGKLFSEF